MGILPALVLIASLTGQDAFPYLSFGVGARELAMGGAAVASCKSAAASYWNPAGLCLVTKGSVLGHFAPQPLGGYPADGDMKAFVAWAQPVRSWAAVGLAVDEFRLGGIECRVGETKNPIDIIDYHETTLSLCGALNALPGLRVGAGPVLYLQRFGGDSLKLYPSMWSLGAGGMFGVHYTPARGWQVGLAARLPAPISWINANNSHNSDRVSPKTTLGIAWKVRRGLVVETDLTARSNRPWVLNVGCEYKHHFAVLNPDSPKPLLSAAVRCGFKDIPVYCDKIDQSAKLTAGAGIESGGTGFRIGLDYVVIGLFGGLYHALGVNISY